MSERHESPNLPLPPGLALPSAQEPTDQYLSENLRPRHAGFDDTLRYSRFMIALIAFDVAAGERDSTMPTITDVGDMYKIGYGFDPKQFNRNRMGFGWRQVQRTNGYYVEGDRPPRDKLLERFQYIADEGFVENDLDLSSARIMDVLSWCTSRDLTPSAQAVLEILGGDTGDVQRIFSIERKYRVRSIMDLYKFGQRVLDENNGPISVDQLDERYAADFPATPSNTLKYVFGTMSKFWLEFDLVPQGSGLSRSDVLRLALRHAINNDGAIMNSTDADHLSADGLFVSRPAVTRRFPTFRDFRLEVQDGYNVYLGMRTQLITQGISPDVVQLMSQRFEPTDGWTADMYAHQSTLAALSQDTPPAAYLQAIVRHGFDLRDSAAYRQQLTRFRIAASQLGIDTTDHILFILRHTPRVSADELLDQIL